MTLSCRAQAFSVENLLRASEKTTVATEISSTLESVVLVSQREFSKLHPNSWTTSSGCASTSELLLANNDHRNPEHVLHSIPYGKFKNEFLLHQNQNPRAELSTMGQYNRGYQNEITHCYQFYKFPHNTDDNDSKDVQVDTASARRSSSADDSNAEEKDYRIRSQYKSAGTSKVPSSCFCHREMSFCNHPAVMTIADIGRSDTSIVAELCHADLWASFHSLGTEMIITKSGRRMFPALKLRISGLDADKHYIVRLEFVQPDTRKYRYIYHSSRWMVSGSGDKLAALQVHRNPERSASGQAICSQIVSFERLKLTNTEPSRTGQVSLISMQKFQPQVVIQEVQNNGGNDGEDSEHYVITFPQTSFMAVTAYQNQQVTTLKIASNPFAKGFRESGKTRIPFQSFVTGLPSLLPCNTPVSYFPGLMKPSTWPHCFQRDYDSNVGNESCDAHSGASGCEDLPAKIMRTEGNNCGSNYLNCDMKRDVSSVEEAMYKSPVITARMHPLSHQGHVHHKRQQHQQEELKEHKHQILSTQQLDIQALLHRLPLNSVLLQHIPVPAVDLINTPNDALQKLPIQDTMHTLTRSAHKSLNIKSEHPLKQLSNVYIMPTNTPSSHVLPSKHVFMAPESNSPRCLCTRRSDNDNIVVSPSFVPSPSVSCVEPNWTFTSGHSKLSRDSRVLPLPLLPPRCITEPTEIHLHEIVSRTECDCGI